MAMFRTFLFSLLALGGALLALVLVTSVASWLPPLLGVHPGGEAQLAWDLAFSVLGGIAAVGFAAWHAPCGPRWHGFGIWLVLAAASLWAAWDMGYDFPRWFVLLLLLSLPLQLGAGLWLATRRLRTAT
jgi:hypothetical protein